ncbi:MAG: hypothetical protein ACLQUZ_16620 [Rhizomicrobium sp.]
MICSVHDITVSMLIAAVSTFLIVRVIRFGQVSPGHAWMTIERSLDPVSFWAITALFAGVDLAALVVLLRASAACFPV